MLDSMQQSNVCGISAGAYNLELFSGFTNFIATSGSKPKLLIFEINLRSFSTEWDKRPEYQFEHELLILNNDFRKFFYKSYSVFKENAKSDFLNTPVFKYKQKAGIVADFIFDDTLVTNHKTKMKLIFHYLYKLNADNKKVIALKNIMELSKKHKLNILFFISPIDYVSGEKYLPNEFNFITAPSVSKGKLCLSLSQK